MLSLTLQPRRPPANPRETPAPRFLSALAVASLLILLLAGANYSLATRLLHLNLPPFDRVVEKMEPVSTPLVLVMSGQDMRESVASFMRKLSLSPEVYNALPRTHPKLVDISWISRANPYPPLLGEFHVAYAKQVGYFSFGYLGGDGRFHQVTFYGGETDTTPSILVRKYRGDNSHDGDYFTYYTFLLSRLRDTDEKRLASFGVQSLPHLDYIHWGTYEGDGLEREIFTVIGTLVELPLIGLLVWRLLRRRRSGVM